MANLTSPSSVTFRGMLLLLLLLMLQLLPNNVNAVLFDSSKSIKPQTTQTMPPSKSKTVQSTNMGGPLPRKYGCPPSNTKLLRAFGFCDLGTPESVMLGMAITIAATRIIPSQDIAFSMFYPLYIGFINRIRFQCNQAYLETKKPKLQQPVPLLWQPQERVGTWFMIYLHSFAMIGILFPFVFLFSVPMKISNPAVPHTFLVLMQVVTEGLAAGPEMHVLPKLLVPIGFNTYRMTSLWSWVKLAGLQWYSDASGSGLKSKVMVAICFLLGLANFLAWTYNLFVFLLLRVSPQFLDTTMFPTVTTQWKQQLWPVGANEE